MLFWLLHSIIVLCLHQGTCLCVILDFAGSITFAVTLLILILFSHFHAFFLCLCCVCSYYSHLNFIAGNQSDVNRLHLWQVFFASPNEWWDQRKNKLNPKLPDFKHRDTGEALWLSKHNPPWVTRQLELLDSKFAGGFAGRRSRLTSWVYDE